MAALCVSTGDYIKASKLYKEALKLRLDIYGFSHPKVATTMCNLAALSGSVGNVDEAANLYKQAISIFVKTIGEKHPNTILVKEKLAKLKEEQ